MNIIKHKYIFLSFSALLIVAAIVSISFFDLKQGIDFTGGTLWQIRFLGDQVSDDRVGEVLGKDLKINEFAVNTNISDNSFLVRLKEVQEAEHQEYLKMLKEKLGDLEELSFESMGAAVGQELRGKAIWAFVLVLLTISLYIAFAFRKVSRPVSSWKYGLITLLTLFHDALIPVGLLAYLGYAQGVEVGVNFVVAILVVMGFSVHDTIVVFDRIRENLKLERSANFNFADLVDKSIKQTFARSINTSLTLVLVLLALYFWGAAALSYFTLIILAGVLVGTYSSIFVASPMLVMWAKK